MDNRKKSLLKSKSFAIVLAIVLLISTSNVFAFDRYSVATGNWNATTTWSATSGGGSGASIPVAGDVVYIEGGFTVSIIANAACANITIGTVTSGTLSFNTNGNLTLTVTGNINVNNGSFTTANALTANTHSLILRGNLTVTTGNSLQFINGDDVVNVTFGGTSNQTVSGAGTTMNFNQVTVNNTGAANNNIVEVLSTNFTVPAAFLTLTDGIFKISGSFSLTNTFFSSVSYTIAAGTGLWLNNPNVTVTGLAGSPTLNGLVRVTSGAFNVGTSTGNTMSYNTGASLTIEGGTMTIAGRFIGASPTTDQIIFNMSGGTLTVANVGNTSASSGSFDIGNAGSSFTMSGGTIILKNENTNGTALDYRNIAGTVSITGGTVQFGTAATLLSPTFVIGVTPTTNILPGLSLVKAAGTTTATLAAPATIRGNIDVPSSTTFNANGQAVSVIGSTAQTIGGSGTTTFGALTINNTSGGVSLTGSISLSAALTLTSGILTIPTGSALTISNGNVIAGTPFSVTKHIATQVNTSDGSQGFLRVNNMAAAAYLFPVGDGANYMPVTLTPTDATLAHNTFNVCVFTGITTDGTPNGTPFSANQKNRAVDAVWTVNNNFASSISSPGVTMKTEWPGSLEGAYFAALGNNLIGIAHYGPAVWGTCQQTSGSNNDITGNFVTLAGITTFSPFAVGWVDPSGGALAIKVTYFNASKGSGYNTLNWQAACSSSQATFEIERSTDGINFTAINSITASQARCAQPFNYTDNTAPSGTVFYRIKIIDVDAKSSYSAIVKLSGQANDILLAGLSPNPVVNVAQLRISTTKKDMVDITVVSLEGKVMYRNSVQLQAGSSVVNLDVANLPGGMYLIKGMFSDGQTNTLKFTKK